LFYSREIDIIGRTALTNIACLLSIIFALLFNLLLLVVVITHSLKKVYW